MGQNCSSKDKIKGHVIKKVPSYPPDKSKTNTYLRHASNDREEHNMVASER
jgi:hypothetical protein